MRKRVDIDRQEIGFWRWTVIIFIVLFYPLLVSIYTVFPPLVGIAGLVIIYYFEKNWIYAMAGILYLLNIDLNLGLPIFLSSFSIILIYYLIYPTTRLMVRCKTCLSLFLIVLIDAFYYMNLFIYDFIFSSSVVAGDLTLIFYIVMDILLGFFL